MVGGSSINCIFPPVAQCDRDPKDFVGLGGGPGTTQPVVDLAVGLQRTLQ